jgi:hypothetical protein
MTHRRESPQLVLVRLLAATTGSEAIPCPVYISFSAQNKHRDA